MDVVGSHIWLEVWSSEGWNQTLKEKGSRKQAVEDGVVELVASSFCAVTF